MERFGEWAEVIAAVAVRWKGVDRAMRALGVALAPGLVMVACGPAPSARTAGSPADSVPSTSQVADRDATSERCVAAARACAAPILAGDFTVAVGCRPDDVVAARGGRDALIAQAQKAAADMKAQGGEIVSFTVDPPFSLAATSTRTYAVVPTHVVVKVNGFEGGRGAYMLGISADQGATWKFVDGLPPDKMTALFPDLPKDLVLPDWSTRTRSFKWPRR